MNLFKATLLASAVAAASLSASAQAATATSTFQVRITITESCTFNSTGGSDVDFGTHARSDTPVSATGTLVVNCSKGTPYNIGLNAGANSSAPAVSATNRRMINGSNYVAYGLFQDSSHATLWGDVVGTSTKGGTGTAVDQPVSVYAQAPTTNAPAGSYTDTVTATITY